MLKENVLPTVERLQSGLREENRKRILSCFGLPESVVGERLEQLETRYPGVRLGLRIRYPEIRVQLYARGTNPDRLERILEQAAKWAEEKLGKHVFSTEGEAMEVVVGKLLVQRGATVAVAESCTGGLIAHQLTNVPGSSAYFLMGAVTYANDAKTGILGVSPKHWKPAARSMSELPERWRPGSAWLPTRHTEFQPPALPVRKGEAI